VGRAYLAAKAVHWLFTIVVVIEIVSGIGIAYFREVEALTFGLLSKALSFQLHDLFMWPFVVLFLLHFYFAVLRKKFGGREK
jgi:cytochrome b subunit of formate dehydrogenase